SMPSVFRNRSPGLLYRLAVAAQMRAWDGARTCNRPPIHPGAAHAPDATGRPAEVSFAIPYSLFPIPYSLFPIPYSLFPIPYSLFPIPYSLFPIPCPRLPNREVLVLQPHVVLRAVVQPLDLRIAEHPHLPRRVADPQLALAHGAPGRHQRAGADEGVLLHHRAVEHDRAHADEHRVLDPAGVDDRLVADRHVLADHGGEPAQLRVRPVVADVDHGAVLDIAARADADEVDVAADHRLRPHRHVVSQLHVADHAGVGIDVDPRAERRKDVAIRPDTVHPPIVGR